MENNRKVKPINWLLFIGILLVGANLRAPITSIGVALPDIKHDLAMSNSAVSVITVVPLIAFAIVSLFAAKTSNRFGLEKTIFVALWLILIGVIVRSVIGISWLYIGTVLIGIGIGFGNVLAPAVIKAKFPLHIGIMTGYYTVVMNVFGGLSSYGTAPLVKAFNYNIAISVIGVITLITIIIWIFQLNTKQDTTASVPQESVNVWKSPLSWQITMLMGGQSLIFYSLINWLPAYLSQNGMSINEAGMYLSIMQIAIIPLTFITPIFATKMKSQFLLTFLTGVCFVIGVSIMLFKPEFALISTVLIGVASGIAFGLVNTFFSLRTEHSQTSAKLSGMAQSVGYIFAAVGPLLFGVLHDATGKWMASLSILLITSLLITLFGSQAGRNRTIEKTMEE
ncbi:MULTISPECIES: CynX/NimT family MFS transporter [Staphylococcus]|jgi:CP family cyanate transporter-like MFS transporter|uniref:MFS transporter n=1 Tax=Staphylococcus nepalensis TaxID=214473 RepID=A0A2T4SD08_9STAP|nr:MULTISPECIES: MFS transporter [Staphylococcus]MBO1205369.1 MFS transporter [Staphylococcus nepalensis]MDW8552644.1 MFS transporter [Staphylococcus nepalensis]PTK60314.1 MFS transporter [Staphylococcus nepalensis]RIO43439.1 MFS transporter [Staphylococcus nepalensis]WQL20488.1 MFS transporter [Staphylococcus nepalensis]